MGHIQSKSDLHTRVLAFIQKHGLMPRGQTVLAGVSGGPDSVCMLHLLARMQETLGVRLHVAHLNHGLRGAEANADASYVSALARDLGIPCTVERQDVAGYQSKKGLSLEEAARDVRYRFFAGVAATTGASHVSVGHTLDDQVESILLHVMRGTGIRGLRGMLPITSWGSQGKTPLFVVRPLLEVTRQETAAYCEQHALRPRTDMSNYSTAFLRNRLRRIMPQIKVLNPAVDQALLRLGKAAGEVMDFLDGEVAKAWPEVVIQEDKNGLILNKRHIRSLPGAVQRHLFLRIWERVRDNPQDIEAVHIEDMLSALGRAVGTSLNLPGGLAFVSGYETVGLGPRGLELDICPYPPLVGEFPLEVPGQTELPGWQVTASLLPPGRATELCTQSAKDMGELFSACMDPGTDGEQLWVRSRRPGDRFQPLGLDGEKKLQDLMVDMKVPKAWRDRVPLVCSPRGVLWVVGYRLSETAKITGNTRRALLLEFRPKMSSTSQLSLLRK